MLQQVSLGKGLAQEQQQIIGLQIYIKKITKHLVYLAEIQISLGLLT